MNNFEGVKNRFLSSSYRLVVRMGVSLVQDWEGYISKSHVSGSRWNLSVGILGIPSAILCLRDDERV